jgi:hypothetical protein
LIAAGSYLTSNSRDSAFLSTSIAGGAIGVGVVITLISFLGCFGAANEKGIMLKTYFALMLILIVLELSVGIAAYAEQSHVTRFFIDGVDSWIIGKGMENR